MAPPLVMDNSVVMTWCFQDEASPYADAVLDSLLDRSAIVPSIWPLEVINFLLMAERRERLRPSDSLRFLNLLSQQPIAIDQMPAGPKIGELLALGRAARLTSYDAAYLELAMREGAVLATLDERLMAAAREMAVPLFEPGQA